jgi:hypothetical protein
MASRQIEGYPTFLNHSAPRAQQALIEVNAVRAISTVGELAPHGSNVRSGVKTAHWSTRKRRPLCPQERTFQIQHYANLPANFTNS